MANFNTIIKRKQYLWLGLILVGGAGAIGGGMYLSDLNLSSEEEAPVQGEPAPDMTGVVDSNFNSKVEQHATTEMQATAADLNKRFGALQGEVDILSKGRAADQVRIEQLSNENAAMQEQLRTLGVRPSVPGGEPAPTPPSPAPGPEGEPQPANYPPQPGGAVPPPTAFYPGNGAVQPPQVSYQSVPVPNQINRKTFIYNKGKKGRELPYIPSGSFAKSSLIEGADANASVTGNESTVPMQLRIIGRVEMPNSKTYDLTGCFVGLEAWGDVSSERAIVRSRSISCKLGEDNIDQKIAGHVSFMGKNGIKGEVVMRNGQILLYAGGAGFLDGIGKGIEKASSTTVGVGATASMSAADIGQAGLGGGVSSAAKTLSDYYIKRAEQYHPVIPIGAGNEVTLVFQDGFQLETLEEARAKAAARKKQTQPAAPSAPAVMSANTPDMLKQLQDFRVGDTVDPETGQTVTQ